MTRADPTEELKRIDRTATRIRLAIGSAGVAVGLAVVSFAIVLAAVLPSSSVVTPGSWVPMGIVVATIAICAAVAVLTQSYQRTQEVDRLVPEIERSVGLRRGELGGALELGSSTPTGSEALAGLGRALVADKLSSLEDWQLLPETLRLAGRRVLAAGVLFAVAVGGLGLLAMRSPAKTLAAATSLGEPWATAFPPPPPRIRVSPGDTAVLRGSRLEVTTIAPQRQSVNLVWQPVGEARREMKLEVAASGEAAGRTDPIESATQFWVEAPDGSESAVFEVLPLDPLLVTELLLELNFPVYLQRPAEVFSAGIRELELPAGTSIRVTGRTNEELAGAALVNEQSGESLDFDVEGQRFSMTWRPRADGLWTWNLQPKHELPGVRPPEPFDITVVQDLMPAVEVVYPGRDTAASVDLRLPMVVDARDDVGLTMIDLETWRISAAGVRSEPTAVPLWEAPATQRMDLRVVLRPTLRLDVLELVPGDTLFYVARARDAHPGHPASTSDTFRVFVPSMTELRRSAAESAMELAEGSRELRDNAADLARAARDAERRSEGRQGEFGATEEARRVLERGQELDQRVREMEEQMEELRQGAEESGLADASMREKFEQLEELFRQIEETGLGEQLRNLEEALRNLDTRQTQRELGDLSSRLREMEDRLEQTLALMERVAIEQSMNDATDSAQQLAERQQALAESFRPDSAWAAEQGDVAEELDRLLERLEAVQQDLTEQGLDAAADSLSQGIEQARSSASDMQAAQSAAMQQGQTGSQQGQSAAAQAAGEMQQASQSVEAAGEMLNEDWKQEALEAVGRATREALDLAVEQAGMTDALSEPDRRPGDLAGRQAALVQGLDRLLESLSEAGQRTALIDRNVGSTAASARERMQSLGEALGGRDGPPRGAGAESMALVETLNDLAGQLMASRQAVEEAGSATGMQEALDQLAQMSQSQAGLNRESGGLMLMQQNGEPMEAALQRLAERQEEIARQLEQLAQRPEAAELPSRPELLSNEADEIAADMARGNLDQNTLRRQEQLFRRLLDAGRSLERDEDPMRRESEAADLSRDTAMPDPRPAIEPGPRYPYPDDAAMSAIPRSTRRLILDYFDRLNAAEEASP